MTNAQVREALKKEIEMPHEELKRAHPTIASENGIRKLYGGRCTYAGLSAETIAEKRISAPSGRLYFRLFRQQLRNFFLYRHRGSADAHRQYDSQFPQIRSGRHPKAPRGNPYRLGGKAYPVYGG